MADTSGLPTEASTAPLPEQIGEYRVQRLIGAGGMATVYAALQKQPRRIVAIKVMRAGVEGDTALRRFRREIEILGKLHHAGIAQVYDAGTFDDGGGSRPYFVMEYIDGARDLVTYAAEKMLSINERLRLFVKVCAAIEHGHRRRVIHRDLKPSNILITRAGEPRVIDFGVARALDHSASQQTQTTEAGRLVGTIQYMAPEQVDAMLQDIDARCDVYALGAILYKLLTGKHPYDLRGMPVYLAAQVIRESDVPPPGALRPDLKGDLETIILKSLEKDRSRRYPDAGALGRDIVRFLNRKPIHARPASAAYRASLFIRRHRVAFTAALIVLGVMITATGLVVHERSRRIETATPQRTSTEPTLTRDTRPQAPALVAAEKRARQPPVAPPVDDRQPFVLALESGTPASLAYDAGGATLIVGTNDGRVEVWNLDTRARLTHAADHDGPVSWVAAVSDVVISTGADNQLVRIDRLNGSLRSRRILACNLSTFAAAADNAYKLDRIAVACDDLSAHLFADGQPTGRARSGRGGITCLAYNAAGDRLAGGTERGHVYVWDAASGAIHAQRDDLVNPVRVIAFIGSSSRLATVTNDHQLRVVELAEDASAPLKAGDDKDHRAIPVDRTIPLSDEPVRQVIINPTGTRLLCVDARRARLADLETLRWSIELDIHAELPAAPDAILALSPDGRWLATLDPTATDRIRVIPIRTHEGGGRGR